MKITRSLLQNLGFGEYDKGHFSRNFGDTWIELRFDNSNKSNSYWTIHFDGGIGRPINEGYEIISVIMIFCTEKGEQKKLKEIQYALGIKQ